MHLPPLMCEGMMHVASFFYMVDLKHSMCSFPNPSSGIPLGIDML
jgi:hypothetical protein